MVEQYNNGEQSSLNYERPSSASSNYNRCNPRSMGTTLQIVKNDRFFNPEKEVRKLTLTEILQSTITEDGRVFCPTNINNSKWNYTDQLDLKEKQKLQKKYQIVQQKWNGKMKNQTSNLKELTAIHLALEHFLPQIKKANFTSILIQMDNTSAIYGINRKMGVQNLYITTRKIWYLIDQNGMALNSRKIKYDDGQTESSGDEQRLLSPTKNLSIHPRNTKMLFNSGHVRFEKEPIIKEICISNTNQRSGQCRKCSKNKLKKIHIPHVITSPNSSDSEDYTEVCHRGFKSHSYCPEMEGTSMVDSSRRIHDVENNSGKCRKCPDSREKYGKKKYVSSTREIRSPIINEYFEYETSNIGDPLLQAFISGKPVKNLLFLGLKTLKELEDIPQKWMLVLEMLTHEMGLRKLDLFILSLDDSTQRSYKGGWSHFVSFFIE
jgi:hypothetical protein